MIVDNSMEQGAGQMTSWRRILKTYHIKQSTTEPYSPWHNSAETEVKMLKRGIKKFTRDRNSPKRVWCFLGEYVEKLRRVTPSTIPSLRGRTPHEEALGWTPDISPLVQFTWWELVYYLDSDGETKFGRWMGPSENSGGSDAY